MRKNFWVGSLVSTILLSFYCRFAPTTQAETQTNSGSATASTPPNPPRTPPPNKTRPGGGLSPTRLSCDRLDDRLQALVPVKNPVLTTSAHPTFLFYVPYAADEIQFGQFSVLTWPGEMQRLGSIIFSLPKAPGIVSVTLPATPEFALEKGQYYHWYFQLYCPGNESLEADLEVNGWVLRASEQARSDLSTASDMWYDMLAAIAMQLQASPQNETLRATWNALMQGIEADAAIQADFAGAIVPQN